MEKILLVLALLGSACHLFDKIAAMMNRRGAEKQEKATGVQQADIIRLKDAQIEDLKGRIRVLEVALEGARQQHAETKAKTEPVQQEIVFESADPMAMIVKDAEEKAKACMVESKRFALAAVEAEGREKSRLLAEARKLADKAAEYRAVANGSLSQQQDHDKAQAKAVIEKAKKADEQLSKRLKQDELARERAKFEPVN